MTNFNKSTIFVRPLLGLANNRYTNNYKNCYVTLEPEMLIHLVFDNTMELSDYQKETLQMLDCLSSFRDKYVEKDNLIYTFVPNEDDKSNIANFIAGKYSKISEGSKQTILFSQHNAKNVTRISNILWPTADVRDEMSKILDEPLSPDAEVFSIPNEQEEIFDISKL